MEIISTQRLHSGVVFDVDLLEVSDPMSGSVEREVVRHPGAVCVLPYDEEHLYMIRQPRHAIQQQSLEIVAGTLDVPGESALDCGKRELAEELGMQAGEWEEVGSYFSSSGYSDERKTLFFARDLSGDLRPTDEEEQITPVKVPLPEIEAVLAEATSALAVIALLQLQKRLGI